MRTERVRRCGTVKFHPGKIYCNFPPTFQEFWRIHLDFRLSFFRLHLFVLSLDQELLTDLKFLRSGCYVASLWKYHNVSPIRKVQPCSCFVNKSRANEDKKTEIFTIAHKRSYDMQVHPNLIGLFVDRSNSSIV